MEPTRQPSCPCASSGATPTPSHRSPSRGTWRPSSRGRPAPTTLRSRLSVALVTFGCLSSRPNGWSAPAAGCPHDIDHYHRARASMLKVIRCRTPPTLIEAKRACSHKREAGRPTRGPWLLLAWGAAQVAR
eukprot:590235-Prymnesium_polylepis.1